MRRLSITQMLAVLEDIEEILSCEGELLIIRHGRAVARMLPVRRPEFRGCDDLRARIPRVERPSAALVRDDRDERG